MKEPLVYIIILNWNGYKDTIECLESLKKITYKNYKIVLIDNGSTDESVKILRTRYHKIKLIENKVNLGFAGGCNVGIKYALNRNSDYVLLLNNDTTVDKHFLSELVKFESSNNLSLISPLIYYQNTTNLIYSVGGKKTYLSHYPFTDKFHKRYHKFKPNEILERDCLVGTALLINKKIVIINKYFDTDYFMYVEDVDYSIRASLKGIKLFTVTSSVIWHKGSSSSGDEKSIFRLYYNSRNLIIFAHKNLHGYDKIVFIGNYILHRTIDMSVFCLNLQFNKAFYLLKGITAGLMGHKGANSTIRVK